MASAGRATVARDMVRSSDSRPKEDRTAHRCAGMPYRFNEAAKAMPIRTRPCRAVAQCGGRVTPLCLSVNRAPVAQWIRAADFGLSRPMRCSPSVSGGAKSVELSAVWRTLSPGQDRDEQNRHPGVSAGGSRVRDISFRHGFMGESAAHFWQHAESWADVWTSYYTDREPESLSVATIDDTVVGDLAGCIETAAMSPAADELLVTAIRKDRLLFRPGTAGFLMRGDRRWPARPRERQRRLHRPAVAGPPAHRPAAGGPRERTRGGADGALAYSNCASSARPDVT